MVTTGPRAACGFTAIELMVVVLVLAVLVTIGLPGLRELVATSQVRSAAGDLRASLARARSEAMVRNAQVDVVPASGNWANGWEVVTGGTVLERRGPAPVTVTPAASSVVSYRLNGRISAGAQALTIAPSNGSAVRARCVYVDPAGRPMVRIDTDVDPANGCE